jgi:hypothetical protein
VLGNRVIDRQDALGEACRRIDGEPGGQRGAPAAIVHQSNATPKFSDRSDTDAAGSQRYVTRGVALSLQTEIGAAQRRCEQEFGEGTFAHGLARPLLGRDDHRARLAVAGDG